MRFAALFCAVVFTEGSHAVSAGRALGFAKVELTIEAFGAGGIDCSEEVEIRLLTAMGAILPDAVALAADGLA